MLRCAGVTAIGVALWITSSFMGRPAVAAPALGVPASPTAVVPEAPVEVPEPVTIILFGTGLAVMAAATTIRRKG